jgi:perosamine synthetase
LENSFLSLYYGSLSFLSLFRSIFYWIYNIDQLQGKIRSRFKQLYPASILFAFTSGRGALAAFLKAVKIGEGDEVVLTAYTCLAVPTAVIASGAKPVYVDIEEKTLNIDSDKLLDVLGPKVKAIVLQHTLGKSADIQRVIEIAKTRNILIIEDCALSIGAQLNNKLLGSFGDAAVFSLELSKTFSCGWGGLLLINNHKLLNSINAFYYAIPRHRWSSSFKDFIQTLISAFSYSSSIYTWLGKYILFVCFKFNFFRRSTPNSEFAGIVSENFINKTGFFQMALLLSQLRDLNKILLKTKLNCLRLRAILKSNGIITLADPEENEIIIAPRISFLVEDRQSAQLFFSKHGIELGEWFDGPLSPIPTTENFNYSRSKYPVANTIAAKVVNIPSHYGVSTKDIFKIKNTIELFSINSK